MENNRLTMEQVPMAEVLHETVEKKLRYRLAPLLLPTSLREDVLYTLLLFYLMGVGNSSEVKTYVVAKAEEAPNFPNRSNTNLPA